MQQLAFDEEEVYSKRDIQEEKILVEIESKTKEKSRKTQTTEKVKLAFTLYFSSTKTEKSGNRCQIISCIKIYCLFGD